MNEYIADRPKDNIRRDIWEREVSEEAKKTGARPAYYGGTLQAKDHSRKKDHK